MNIIATGELFWLFKWCCYTHKWTAYSLRPLQPYKRWETSHFCILPTRCRNQCKKWSQPP